MKQTHPTSRKPTRVALTLLLVASIAVVQNAGTATQAYATTTSLVTASTRQLLADQVNTSYFAGGATRAVVVQNTAGALHLGTNLASTAEIPVVVATSGATATDVISRLTALGVTAVDLVSETPGWFTSGFESALNGAAVTVDRAIQVSDVFTRWTTAAGTSADRYAVAKTDDVLGVALATSFANAQRIPLVLFEPGTATSSLDTFFAAITTSHVTVFGSVAAAAARLDPDDGSLIAIIDLTEPLRAATEVATILQQTGKDANRVVTAAKDAPDEIGLAGLVAAETGTIAIPAGVRSTLATDSPVNQYLTLWKSGAHSVVLVGTSYTSTNLNAVAAPTTTSFPSSPAFRVTGLTRTSSTFTLTLTSVSGAAAYTAYDIEGTPVATSSTPSLVFTEAPMSALVVATNSSDDELARIDLHANFLDATSELESVVVIGANGGTNHLTILGQTETPRLITRIENDVFEFPPVWGPTEPLAITCSTAFTDVTTDGTKEYLYHVTTLTNVDTHACDGGNPAIPAAPDEGVIVAKVGAPPTDFPEWERSEASNQRRAGTTAAHKLVNESIAQAQEGTVQRGPGDGWDPVIAKWVAYIPETKIPFPPDLYTGDPDRPAYWFEGDDHGTNNPNGSARYTQTVTFNWGTSHSVTYAETMGTTRRYKCTIVGSSCTFVNEGTAPKSQLWMDWSLSNATSGYAYIIAEAKNPLVSWAPPINSNILIDLNTKYSAVTGYHDMMPKHEFYIGTPASEYVKVYESSFIGSSLQIACLYSSMDIPVWGCAAFVNAQI